MADTSTLEQVTGANKTEDLEMGETASRIEVEDTELVGASNPAQVIDVKENKNKEIESAETSKLELVTVANKSKDFERGETSTRVVVKDTESVEMKLTEVIYVKENKKQILAEPSKLVRMIDQLNLEKKDFYAELPGPLQIFMIPTYIKRRDQVAYEPKMVSIGPYHYGKAPLEPMQAHKERALIHFLRRSLKQRTIQPYVVALTNVVVELRACYEVVDEITKWRDVDFVKLMLLDGVFLLEFLNVFRGSQASRDYAPIDPIFGDRGHNLNYNYVMEDLLLLENQIPYQVLSTLLRVSEGQTEEGAQDILSSLMMAPQEYKGHHLLDMYIKGMLGVGNTQQPNNNVKVAASKLNMLGIKFRKVATYNDIKFDQQKKTLSLPSIVINQHTGIIVSSLAKDEDVVEVMKELTKDTVPGDVDDMSTKIVERVTTFYEDKEGMVSKRNGKRRLALHFQDTFGWTALHWSAFYGKESKVKRTGGKAIILANTLANGAGALYSDKCDESYLKVAGDCFHQAECWCTAAEVLYCKANCLTKCLFVCTNGNLFDKGLDYIRKWEESAILDAVSFKSQELTEMEQSFLVRCALHYHQLEDINSMVKFVRAFSSMEEKRAFLRSRNYLGELILLEAESGNFTEASSVARLKGDSVILMYVFGCSLWANGSEGWPLHKFLNKEELLLKAKMMSKNNGDLYYDSVRVETSILSDTISSLSMLGDCLGASQRLKNRREEIITYWKILDLHLHISARKYFRNDKVVMNPSRHAEELISQNRVSTDTLIYYWNQWKEIIVEVLKYLKSLGTQLEEDYKEYESFCLGYLGVRKHERPHGSWYVLFVYAARCYWISKTLDARRYVADRRLGWWIPFRNENEDKKLVPRT